MSYNSFAPCPVSSVATVKAEEVAKSWGVAKVITLGLEVVTVTWLAVPTSEVVALVKPLIAVIPEAVEVTYPTSFVKKPRFAGIVIVWVAAVEEIVQVSVAVEVAKFWLLEADPFKVASTFCKELEVCLCPGSRELVLVS